VFFCLGVVQIVWRFRALHADPVARGSRETLLVRQSTVSQSSSLLRGVGSTTVSRPNPQFLVSERDLNRDAHEQAIDALQSREVAGGQMSALGLEADIGEI
jgi:hypothetical protein